MSSTNWELGVWWRVSRWSRTTMLRRRYHLEETWSVCQITHLWRQLLDLDSVRLHWTNIFSAVNEEILSWYYLLHLIKNISTIKISIDGNLYDQRFIWNIISCFTSRCSINQSQAFIMIQLWIQPIGFECRFVPPMRARDQCGRAGLTSAAVWMYF